MHIFIIRTNIWHFWWISIFFNHFSNCESNVSRKNLFSYEKSLHKHRQHHHLLFVFCFNAFILNIALNDVIIPFEILIYRVKWRSALWTRSKWEYWFCCCFFVSWIFTTRTKILFDGEFVWCVCFCEIVENWERDIL